MNDSKKNAYLPKDYQPSTFDVICGRGIKCFHHSGNIVYRNIIQTFEDCYEVAQTKLVKSKIVLDVIHEVRSSTKYRCKFIRWCSQHKLWYEISERILRQKVGQTLRDTLITKNPQKRSFKNDEAAFLKSLRCIDFSLFDGTVMPHYAVSKIVASPNFQDRSVDGPSSSLRAVKDHKSKRTNTGSSPTCEFPKILHVSQENQDFDITSDKRSTEDTHHSVHPSTCHDNVTQFEFPHMWQESSDTHEATIETDDSDLSSIGWWESGFDHYS
jgi:hypothetical protein